MNGEEYKGLNRICIITIIVSTIIGFINPYEYYMTIIYSFWYSFAMFIFFINTMIGRTISRSANLKGEIKVYVDMYCKFIESKIIKIFIIGSLCFTKIISLIIQSTLYLNKVNMGMNFIENAFLQNNALLMFILATAAEIAVVVVFAIRIWKENRQVGEKTLCH